MEWYHGRLIAYSLGNFAGYKVFSMGGPLSISGILRVTLKGDGSFDSGTLVPTRMVGAGIPALDPAESAHGLVRTLSKDDFGAPRRQGRHERRPLALGRLRLRSPARGCAALRGGPRCRAQPRGCRARSRRILAPRQFATLRR